MVMSMKVMRLPSYWNAADAQLIIAILDELRDLLADTYGDEIIEMHRRKSENNALDNGQTELPFNDPVEF